MVSFGLLRETEICIKMAALYFNLVVVFSYRQAAE